MSVKLPNIKLHLVLFGGSCAVICEQMNSHDKATAISLQLLTLIMPKIGRYGESIQLLVALYDIAFTVILKILAL
jgi:hypothetical protein